MKKLKTSFIISCFITIIFCMFLAGCSQAATTQASSTKTTSVTTSITKLTTSATNGSVNLAGKIVFASTDVSGNSEIYVVNADGTNLKQLTNNSIGAQYPAWSPDGKKIAFAAVKDGGIYTMNADGTNLTRIVYKTAYDEYTDKDYICENTAPSWSPDGSMICYESYGDEDSGTTVPNANIYIVNADGTNMRRITNGLTYEGQPAWSPDGTKIIVNRWSDSRSKIYVMDADGNNVSTINVPIDAREPVWISQ